jgi:outer membrane protein
MKKRIITTMLALSIMTLPMNIYGEEALDQVEDTKVEEEQVEEEKLEMDLSLERAVELAIENSQELEINKLDIEVKEIEKKEARYREKKYDDIPFSLGTVEGFALDENMLSTQAENALEEEILKTDYIKEDIKHRVTNAYYGVLQAKQNLEAVDSNVEDIKRNYNIIQKKVDLGVAAKSEAIMSEVSLNEAYTNREDAKEKLEMARRGFNMVIDYPLDAQVKLTTNFKQEEFDANLEEDIELAYEKRFDIIQLQNSYDLVKLDFKTNKKKYTPNTFVYKYKERSVARVENLLDNIKKNIEFDIRNKYDAIESAKKQIQIANTNIAKAEEGLRLRELAYNAGTGIQLEVKEAQTQLFNANLALSNAISNYNLKILEYNKAVNIGNIR